MQDKDLYFHILGLTPPWSIKKVDLDPVNQIVDIYLEHKAGILWTCPECGKQQACYDHSEERVWRHLDTCQFKTLIHAKIPRVKCQEHGVLQVKTPWAEAKSRFTLLMEKFAIDVILRCQNIKGACELLSLTWDEAWNIMNRSVKRGQNRKGLSICKKIGVDEKSFRHGHNSYMTVVCDLQRSTVEYVADDRRTESLQGYYSLFSNEELAKIEVVAMDMWDPYIKATKIKVPDAENKIVFDRFHIMKLVNTAVDEVRRKEQRELSPEDQRMIKGARYAFLYSKENLPDKYKATLNEVKDSNLKIARAWAMKESLRQFWDYDSIGWATKFFKNWSNWVARSKLAPMKKLVKTLRRYFNQIITYTRHKVTNAVAEGINSKIMSVKRRACGFRNADNYKMAIYFYCGGLDLYPC